MDDRLLETLSSSAFSNEPFYWEKNFSFAENLHFLLKTIKLKILFQGEAAEMPFFKKDFFEIKTKNVSHFAKSGKFCRKKI